jgi:hypothetical protein
MVSKNKLKEMLKQEFESVLPNVYNNVAKTKVIPSPLGMEISIKKRLSIKLSQAIIAASLILGVSSFGGYSYYTPNTVMSISVTPNIINTLLRLNTVEEVVGDPNQEVNFTMTINSYNRVVEVEADSSDYNQAIINMGLNNMMYQQALKQLFISLDEAGRIDMLNSVGQVKFKVLDSNSSRQQRFNDYIKSRLSNELGLRDSKMIKLESIEYNTSLGLTDNMHPAKAMAINEIMLNSNEYTVSELASKDKLELIRIMMEIKRRKR